MQMPELLRACSPGTHEWHEGWRDQKPAFSNKYYVMICVTYLLTQLCQSTINMGVYFMKYILGDENLLSTFSLFINVPLILGLVVTPWLVAKMKGMYKINIIGYSVGILGRIGVMVGGYMMNVPMMVYAIKKYAY